jgi:hypothetical protein
MTTATDPRVAWSDLVRHSHLDRCGWHVTGAFQSGSTTYSGTFNTEAELTRFLDFLLASPEQFATSRMYRRAAIHPFKPEYDLSNLRFQFDPEHEVAAAALLADDHDEDRLYRWVTRGNAGRDDVVLAYDSWNQHETQFPPEAFITVRQLRDVVVQWAFGEVLPPPAVRWGDAPDNLAWF